MPEHVLTPLDRSSRPGAILVIGYDLVEAPKPRERGLTTYVSQCAVIAKFGRGPKGLYCTRTVVECDTSSLFIRLVELTARWKTAICMTWNLPVMLEVSDFRVAVSSGMLRVSEHEKTVAKEGDNLSTTATGQFITLNNPPNLIKVAVTDSQQRLLITDIRNYGIESLQQLATLLNSNDTIRKSCRDLYQFDGQQHRKVAMLVGAFAVEYDSTVSEYQLGGFRLTQGSQAIAALRTGRIKQQVYRTTDPAMQRLERAAYIGGRMECFGHGHYQGKCYYLDMASMYPYVAQNRSMPYEFLEARVRPDAGTIDRFMANGYIVARAYIKPDLPYIPVKSKGGTTYPTGKFNALLHDAEFRLALGRGELDRVDAIACYKSAPWLAEYAVGMVEARNHVKRSNLNLREAIIKRITNALWGRLGLNGSVWVPDDRLIPAGPYATWIEKDSTYGEPKLCRSIDWMCERQEKGVVVEDTMVAAAGAITSYGRVLLWHIMQVAGLNNVLYVATDGLILNQCGYSSIENSPLSLGEAIGSLRVLAQADSCIISSNGVFLLGEKQSAMGVGVSDRPEFLTFSRLDPRYSGEWEREGEIDLHVHGYRHATPYWKLIMETANTPFTRLPTPHLEEEMVDTTDLFGLAEVNNCR